MPYSNDRLRCSSSRLLRASVAVVIEILLFLAHQPKLSDVDADMRDCICADMGKRYGCIPWSRRSSDLDILACARLVPFGRWANHNRIGGMYIRPSPVSYSRSPRARATFSSFSINQPRPGNGVIALRFIAAFRLRQFLYFGAFLITSMSLISSFDS